ncbi:hypothetical protein Sme01_36750 [Sphaerisporangium melleum]|uniref:Uncharacterized protein n=1 Tax=Sphaerisporangium melleum TaxID=321316 RepID=A0A917RNX1_9ACTN|nr:hypothetical protein [Sphaerisporangium melleum]GGL16661.1 hypothetical protein GCM10007964_68300 [Sphaerisporangium melleum]GII71199.1 hypothetical protein Sme01_36750 [Sphaerisporangium melleum]
MPAPDVAALLTELERSDPEAADDARIAVEWLTGGEPLETITQLDVCEFLWYTLPLKVTGDHGDLARALGRLLRLGGMERYAALCSSPSTTRILRAYARDGEEAGMAAYQRALNATGVLPPDVPELHWSSIMGPEEMGAHIACSAALELAVVSGELRPAANAWKAQAEALTRRWLTAPRTELGGDNWVGRVHGERLNRWVLGRGAARRELAQPFEVRLHAPIAAPEGRHFPALRWLLETAAEPGGVALTRRHNIAVPVADAAAERFGWPAGGVAALRVLRRIAEREMRAVVRTEGALLITPAGRRLLDDPAALWQAAAPALLTPAAGEREVQMSVREVGLMLLVDVGGLPPDPLAERVAEVVAGEGWRTATPADVAGPLGELRDRLEALHLCHAPGPDARAASTAEEAEPDGPLVLTAAGRAAALTALRIQALRPRKYVTLS